jgi:hypothetical protein
MQNIMGEKMGWATVWAIFDNLIWSPCWELHLKLIIESIPTNTLRNYFD